MCIYIPSVHEENIEVDEKTKQDNRTSKVNRTESHGKMMSTLPQAFNHISMT